jgi:hypothetical protein
MKIGVYLTCQGKFFERLARTEYFNIEILFCEYYRLFERNEPFPKIWQDIDAFLYQPILEPPTEYYRDENLLENFVAKKATRIRLPYVMYNGIFPWHQKPATNDVKTQYGNAWIDNDVANFVSGDKTSADILYAENKNILDWHKMSISRLRQKEAESDIHGIADLIEENLQKLSLFWTPNHPRGPLAYKLRSEAFRLLGLPKIPQAYAALLDDVLTSEQTPVLPCVERELGIKRHNDLAYFEGDRIPMTPRQYIEHYIAVCKSRSTP